MRARFYFAGLLILTMAYVWFSPTGEAGEIHIKADGSGDYSDLEGYRSDPTNSVLIDGSSRGVIQAGDTIVLHDSPVNVNAPLYVYGGGEATIRSAAGKWIKWGDIDVSKAALIFGHTNNSDPDNPNHFPVNNFTMNFDTEAGSTLEINDYISGVVGDFSDLTFNKTGAGTLKLNGSGSNNITGKFVGVSDTEEERGSVNLHVKQGTLHLSQYVHWNGEIDPEPTPAPKYVLGEFRVDRGATFRPTITRGNMLDYTSPKWFAHWTHMQVSKLFIETGARLEISGISSLPVIGSGQGGSLANVTYDNLIIGDTEEWFHMTNDMQINNSLMQAKLVNKGTIVDLVIDKVNNLATLDGMNSAMDVLRMREGLSEEEQLMFDSIYWRGYATSSDLAFAQSYSGAIAGTSQLAVHHNLMNVLRKISRRTTDYQREELEVEITGSEYAYGNLESEYPNYGELWAYIDQTWIDQKDSGDMAGYRYNPQGLGIGYERHFDEWIVGAVGRYDSGDMELRHDNRTKNETQNFTGSAYVSWARSGYFMTGTISLGYGWNEATSAISGPNDSVITTSGNYNTSMYGASYETGYMINLDKYDYPVRITPYGSLTYAGIHRGAINETGGGVKYDKHLTRSKWNMYEAIGGLRIAMPMLICGKTIIPSTDFSIARTMGNENGTAHLVSDPGASWKIPVTGDNRTALRLNAGITAHLRDNLSMGLEYDMEVRQKMMSNELNFNMTLGF